MFNVQRSTFIHLSNLAGFRTRVQCDLPAQAPSIFPRFLRSRWLAPFTQCSITAKRPGPRVLLPVIPQSVPYRSSPGYSRGIVSLSFYLPCIIGIATDTNRMRLDLVYLSDSSPVEAPVIPPRPQPRIRPRSGPVTPVLLPRWGAHSPFWLATPHCSAAHGQMCSLVITSVFPLVHSFFISLYFFCPP